MQKAEQELSRLGWAPRVLGFAMLTTLCYHSVVENVCDRGCNSSLISFQMHGKPPATTALQLSFDKRQKSWELQDETGLLRGCSVGSGIPLGICIFYL